MTGKTSRRQWMPWRVRTLLATILALGMLIPMVSAYAQATPTNSLCVEGSVINFDETLLNLDAVDNTWLIEYTLLDSAGEPTELFVVSTDEDGYFELPAAGGPAELAVGTWRFRLLVEESGNGPWEGITSLQFDVPLTYQQQECAQIRWKLVRRVPVVVTKIDDQHNLLNDWLIRAEPARGNWFASPVELKTGELVTGTATFYLTEGQWVFKEFPPAGVRFVPIVPSSGHQTLTVEWKANPNGQPIPLELRFKNRVTAHGCLDVYKSDIFEETSTPLAGWKMTVKRANGTIVATWAKSPSATCPLAPTPWSKRSAAAGRQPVRWATRWTSLRVIAAPKSSSSTSRTLASALWAASWMPTAISACPTGRFGSHLWITAVRCRPMAAKTRTRTTPLMC